MKDSDSTPLYDSLDDIIKDEDISDDEKMEIITENLDDEDNNKENETVWDGSESEFVEDNEASIYEEDTVGIKLCYALTEDEIFNAVYLGNLFNNSKRKNFVYITVFSVLCICFIIFYFINKNIFNMVMAGFCVLFAISVFFLPRFYIKRFAKAMADGKKIEVSVYPDRLDIGTGEGKWQIDLDNSCIVREIHNMIVITSDDKSFIIPHRVIEPDLLADITAMIFAGGIPTNEE